MQEPYGAYSWYAVNDQPSDKAFYDVTIDAPKAMVGVANGTPASRGRRSGDRTVTHWHLPEPAASYLITIAIGAYTETQRHRAARAADHATGRRATGPSWCKALRYTPEAIAYLERQGRSLPVPDAGDARRARRTARWRRSRWSRSGRTATRSRATCSCTSSRTSGTATRSPRTTGATCG